MKYYHSVNNFAGINDVQLEEHDVPEDVLGYASVSKYVCLDIETSGLDWSKDHMATCQVCVPGVYIGIVRISDNRVANVLKKIIEDKTIQKIFHHALFDLRFFAYKWAVSPQNIVCTKVCSKILFPSEKEHSLKRLLSYFFSLEIDKSQRLSDWYGDLTSEQIQYAVNDVLYLFKLYMILCSELKKERRLYLAKSAFDFIPTRVKLDVLGCDDVFLY